MDNGIRPIAVVLEDGDYDEFVKWATNTPKSNSESFVKMRKQLDEIRAIRKRR